jgi:hypothetical protein
MTVEIAPGPAMSGMPSGTIDGSAVDSGPVRAWLSSWASVVSPIDVKRMPPAIWKAGSVMPNAEKIAPPVSAKTARISAAAALARTAILRRCSGAPAVSETKIGAASIGLITEKSDEKASTTNFASAEENIGGF